MSRVYIESVPFNSVAESSRDIQSSRKVKPMCAQSKGYSKGCVHANGITQLNLDLMMMDKVRQKLRGEMTRNARQQRGPSCQYSIPGKIHDIHKNIIQHNRIESRESIPAIRDLNRVTSFAQPGTLQDLDEVTPRTTSAAASFSFSLGMLIDISPKRLLVEAEG